MSIETFHTGSTLLDCIVGGGWPSGSLINIQGDTSSGKCIKNAFLLSSKGMELIDQIGDHKHYGQSEYIETLAVDQENKDSSSHFWKEQVNHTIKVTTRHGYELEATPDHKIKVWKKDCTYEMKRLKDLEEGDVAVVAKSTLSFNTEYVKIQYIQSNFSKHLKSINIPEYVTEELGYFLGLLVADGDIINDKSICFSNSQEWFKTNLQQHLSNLFHIEHICNQKDAGQHQIGRIQLNEFIRQLLKLSDAPFTARYKYIPDVILKSPKSVQIHFIRALVDCDSDSDGSYIEYTSASKSIVDALQLMLLNLGIVTNKSPKIAKDYPDHIYWRLYIPTLYIKKYIDLVGTDKYKDLIISEPDYHNDFDHIPYVYEHMIEDRNNLRDTLNWNKSGQITNPQYKNKNGRTYFPKLNLEHFTIANKPLIETFKSCLELYKSLFDYNFYTQFDTEKYHYDPIVNIIHNYDTTDVYDVHIPNNHLFWSNGFISHNTLLILEAAANHLLKWPNSKVALTEREPSFSMDYVTSLGIPTDKIDFWQEIYTFEDWFARAQEFKESLPEGEYGLLIMDSLDSLSDDAEMARDITDSSFGANKPKKISEALRRMAGEFEERHITSMIISQLRDQLNSPVPMKKASGGHAVPFYSGVILRLNEAYPQGKIKRTVNGVERIIGLNVHAKCNKCKVGPPFREGNLRLMFGYGIDDIATNLEWLKTMPNGLAKIKPIGDTSLNEPEEDEKPKKSKKPKEEGGKSTVMYMKKLMELPKEEIDERAAEIAEITREAWKDIEAAVAPKYTKY